MITNGNRISFGANENVLTIDFEDGCTTLNILGTTELYILSGGILCYMIYVSKKNFLRKKKIKKRKQVRLPWLFLYFYFPLPSPNSLDHLP